MPVVKSSDEVPVKPDENGAMPVRYRAGVISESRRGVHRAVRMPGERLFVGLCGESLAADVVEVGASGGHPCLRCVSAASFGLVARAAVPR